jgi:hypothetical protein
MGLYLSIEVNSSLSPYEFRERVIVPLGEALEREGVGRILDGDPEKQDGPEGRYELALQVSDQERARQIVRAVLKSANG